MIFIRAGGQADTKQSPRDTLFKEETPVRVAQEDRRPTIERFEHLGIPYISCRIPIRPGEAPVLPQGIRSSDQDLGPFGITAQEEDMLSESATRFADFLNELLSTEERIETLFARAINCDAAERVIYSSKGMRWEDLEPSVIWDYVIQLPSEVSAYGGLQRSEVNNRMLKLIVTRILVEEYRMVAIGGAAPWRFDPDRDDLDFRIPTERTELKALRTRLPDGVRTAPHSRYDPLIGDPQTTTSLSISVKVDDRYTRFADVVPNPQAMSDRGISPQMTTDKPFIAKGGLPIKKAQYEIRVSATGEVQLDLVIVIKEPSTEAPQIDVNPENKDNLSTSDIIFFWRLVEYTFRQSKQSDESPNLRSIATQNAIESCNSAFARVEPTKTQQPTSIRYPYGRKNESLMRINYYTRDENRKGYFFEIMRTLFANELYTQAIHNPNPTKEQKAYLELVQEFIENLGIDSMYEKLFDPENQHNTRREHTIETQWQKYQGEHDDSVPVGLEDYPDIMNPVFIQFLWRKLTPHALDTGKRDNVQSNNGGTVVVGNHIFVFFNNSRSPAGSGSIPLRKDIVQQARKRIVRRQEEFWGEVLVR